MFEFRTITRHAGTVLAGQLAVMAFGVTDTVVAGRHSDLALAALSVGSAVYISVFVGLMGVLQGLLPIWAELHGGRRHAELGPSVRQALYLCAIVSVAGMAALGAPGPLLNATGVPTALQAEVRQYLGVLALALPPALLFRMYSTLNQSVGMPQLVTWLQIGSLLLKVPLSVWFAFGGAGLPAAGAVGCAVATLVVNYVLLGLAVWMLRSQDVYRPFRLWQRMEPPDWRQIGIFARLGVPSGLAIMIEVTSFTLMALFIARLGTQASASHQVASNMAAVLYMVPLSLAIATSARVSYWLGAGQPQFARRVIGTGFRIALTAALALSSLLWLLREPIAGAYATNASVITAASALLGWVALYHLADAAQAVCVFVLRCYRVTVAPLLVYSVLLWGIGLAGGYVLAYRGVGSWAPLKSPLAFWGASAAALAATAVLMALILLRVIRPARAPARPRAES